MNKKKIFNDPIYGLVSFEHKVLYKIIDHPYFQRLRRIGQQALSHYVYPGALHTRFHHALGALHLMSQSIETLRSKGVHISNEESKASSIAILLHDIGHGPYSHALEGLIVRKNHEEISLQIMEKIGLELGEDFSLAINIFKGAYHRKFLTQLVSSQLDMDRMDYLNRDSYFSGVAEGIIGYDRIIKMLSVVDDELVIEEKGIYSVETFLVSRRIMYWQVYLHKTVIAAEQMLVSILKRYKYLAQHKKPMECGKIMSYFLQQDIETLDDVGLSYFLELDDYDIMYLIKMGAKNEDLVLRTLCENLLNRKLFKVSLQAEEPSADQFSAIKLAILNKLSISEDDLFYFFIIKKESNLVYKSGENEIKILTKKNGVIPYSKLNTEFADKKSEVKYAVCYFKD